jgi:Glyoxalase-like domain
MHQQKLALDHLVLGVPDLEQGAAWFEMITGVRPAFGGRHATGTANYLVGLGGDRYVEIIGILPEGRGDGVAQPFHLERLTSARLVTWCLRSSGIQDDVESAKAAGLDLGEILSLSRLTPDGDTLAWKMTRRSPMYRDGVIPFLIDWGSTPHPTARDLPRVELTNFRLSHPEPNAVRSELDTLGQSVSVVAGAPMLHATLGTPSGPVALPG